LANRRLAGDRGRAQRLDGRPGGARERRHVGEQSIELARGLVEMLQHRLVRRHRGAELGQRGLELLQQRRQPLQRDAQVGLLGRGRAGGPAGFGDEAVDVDAVVGQRRDHAVGVPRQVLDRGRVVGEQVEQVVGFGERGNGPAQGGLEIPGARGGGSAELVDDQREPLAVGQPHHVLEQVGGDGRLRMGDRDRGAGLQDRPAGSRVAVDEVLADQRLGTGLAGCILVELAESGARDLDRDDGVERFLIEVDRLDRARGDTGNLEVGAGDESERVVELDLVGPGGRSRGRAGGQEHEYARRQQERA
jgi:hypothetical protein